MKLNNTLTQSQLKAVINYNPESGEFIWINPIANRLKVGDIAGSINKHGYRYIYFNRKYHRACRLAWFYMTGEWPENHIDHINRIRDDDRFCNLREATKIENGQNRILNKNGTSTNIMNVFKRKSSGNYYASVFHKGKRILCKTFNNLKEAENAVIETKLKNFTHFNEI